MPNIQKKSCERFLSLDEFRALLSHASPREHVVLRILAVCGLRPAEVLVLRIEDFEGSQLRIDEALKERQKGAPGSATRKQMRATTSSLYLLIWNGRSRYGLQGIQIATILARSCSRARHEQHSEKTLGPASMAKHEAQEKLTQYITEYTGRLTSKGNSITTFSELWKAFCAVKSGQWSKKTKETSSAFLRSTFFRS
jgi:hypothetical protein